MNKLVIKVQNNKNYKMLIDILKHIDFVEIEENNTVSKKSKNSFKQLFGKWKDRDIDLAKIRKKAWRS